MLDLAVSPQLSQDVWDALSLVSELPFDEEDFLTGQPGTLDACRRSHKRLPMPSRTVLVTEGKELGAYSIDVSPEGIGLYSPIQLMPMQQLVLQFADCQTKPLRIHNCSRIQKNCYRCGSRFLKGKLGIAEYCDFMRTMRVPTA